MESPTLKTSMQKIWLDSNVSLKNGVARKKRVTSMQIVSDVLHASFL